MIECTQEQIMKDWEVNNSDNPFVSICCITYNQVPYIEQCLDGLLMQKTSFPFDIWIHDDCSNDGTKEIIEKYVKKYPKIIIPLFEEENQYSKGGYVGSEKWLYPFVKGKYIACCEGDDYWCDSNKLQLQVDFLEKNQDYGLCYTLVKRYIQRKNSFDKNLFGNEVNSFEQLIKYGNKIPTLSVCMRTDLIRKYMSEIDPATKDWLMGDYPRWLYISKNSKIKFFDKITGVYRVLNESASHSKDFGKSIAFINSTADIKHYFDPNNQYKDYIENCKILDTVIKKLQLNIKQNYKECLGNYKTGIMNDLKYKVLMNPLLRLLYKMKLGI